MELLIKFLEGADVCTATSHALIILQEEVPYDLGELSLPHSLVITPRACGVKPVTAPMVRQ